MEKDIFNLAEELTYDEIIIMMEYAIEKYKMNKNKDNLDFINIVSSVIISKNLIEYDGKDNLQKHFDAFNSIQRMIEININ